MWAAPKKLIWLGLTLNILRLTTRLITPAHQLVDFIENMWFLDP